MSFVLADEFSVRVTKFTSKIGVSWTHSCNTMNYGHIIARM